MIKRGYDMDAKLCYYSVPDNAPQINETEVYVAFVHGPLLQRGRNSKHGTGRMSFRARAILGFVNGAVLELNADPPIMMAQLLTFAQQQVRHAFSMRRSLPEFVIEEVSIPEGYADLGDRQLTTRS